MNFESTDHPIESAFPKLIRDNIPAIHERKTGKPSQTRIADNDTEYLLFLLKKLVEESQEARFSSENNNLQEELADVLEIIDAIVKLKDWTREDINKLQKEKREKNGGFEKRILLLSK